MSSKLIKSELEYLIFSEVYQRFQEPKAKRKALSLMEAAITCISRKGFDAVTLEMVAREAAVTRPSIKHYFANLEELKLFSIKYIRLLFQKFVLDEVSRYKEPDQMIAAYIESCFGWVKTRRAHSLVWLAFLHQCAHSSKMREVNTVAVQTGDERIRNLLNLGKDKGVFNFSDVESAAKAIQVIITGALVSSVSENFDDDKKFISQIREQCFQILNLKKI